VVIYWEHAFREAGTMLFALSVLAIIPLAALLSRTTESVAERILFAGAGG
jgi:Ca2+:H+ antiporter